jgi:hypothetical protein
MGYVFSLILLIFHNMKIPKGQLTARQQLFCQMYVGPGKRNAALSARMAGYAAGCSHVTGCQLLQHPRVAAAVRGLEEAVAREVGVSRQEVIAQLLGAADLARDLREPAAMISAFRNLAQLCGYYRQQGGAAGKGEDGGEVLGSLNQLSDRELGDLIKAGAG